MRSRVAGGDALDTSPATGLRFPEELVRPSILWPTSGPTGRKRTMGAPTANGSALTHHNGSPPTAASWSVEVVYRGIFQKRLANRISRGVVLGARKEGKVGTAFARYGDSPERNGVPCK